MRKYGLVSKEVVSILNRMEFERKDWGALFEYFGGKSLVQAYSMNRCFREYYEMAEKAKKGIARETRKAVEFSWKGFIDCKLTETDKANYAAWDVADSDVWDGIAQYCEAGIKISVTYNDKNASFSCAGTGQASSRENNGYCVVAYAKTPYEAARVWLFKVATLLPPVWSEYDSGEADSIG